MLLSGYESDESEPILVHFVHLSAVDPSLSRLRLGIGYYALRTRLGDDWHIYGAYSDAEIDEFLDRGIVDDQHDSLHSPTGLAALRVSAVERAQGWRCWAAPKTGVVSELRWLLQVGALR